MITTRHIQSTFLTPAFLMNGERGGPTSGAQWRTPPFKACLRQWWRVAYSTMHAHAVVVDEMRNAEQDIFGGTSGDSGKRSSVRIRLDSWTQGSMTQGAWQFGRKIQVGKNSVDALTYAGFGRVTSKAGGIKPNATIQAREHATLRLAFPEKDAPLIDLALALMSRFGNLGGRSRNGWGALHLAFDPVQSGFADLLTEAVCRDWRDCLDQDWAHAIGADESGPLIWKTAPKGGWHQLMGDFAEIRAELRHVFPLALGANNRPSPRHWLSYPVTMSSVTGWKGRIPNSIRFSAVLEDSGLVGLVYHMPCVPPAGFAPRKDDLQQIWQTAHQFLDEQAGLSRASLR